MNYREIYDSKKKTPQELANMISGGDSIGFAAALSEPPAIIEAVTDRVLNGEIRDIKHFGNFMIPRHFGYENPGVWDKMKTTSLFLGGSGVRPMVKGGHADYVANHLSQQPLIWKENFKPVVYAALVSPMDEHGYFSFGVSSLEGQTMKEIADVILLEVSPNVPRIHGNNFIHISDITALCESDAMIPEIPLSEPDDDDKKIAAMIAERIDDGSCMQFGIGRIPDAVGMMLKDKKHLGIHTELFCSSMYELVKAGAVDNSRKKIHKGKSVFTFAGGTKETYDYLNDNPACEGHPVDYINNPYVIAQNDNVVSINACIEADIFGQVCAESIGPVSISGSGGQLDYVRGAGMSKGGKSFIVIHSTAKNGQVSTVKSMLTPGAHVTTPKNDVDMIVTEYGVAELKYRTASERAEALINIAHPDMREKLRFEAKKIGLMI